MTPGKDGWTETILAAFSATDTKYGGWYANSGVILDAAGNIYGTVAQGGAYSGGAVFELIPAEKGGWTEKILHSFHSTPTGLAAPYGGLVLDKSGNLFGTAEGGGVYANGQGGIFEMTPDGRGGWAYAVLHEFNFADGGGPNGTLAMDAEGNLYGTTTGGGTHNLGTVFEDIR